MARRNKTYSENRQLNQRRLCDGCSSSGLRSTQDESGPRQGQTVLPLFEQRQEPQSRVRELESAETTGVEIYIEAFTVEQVAHKLNLSTSTVRREIAGDRIRVTRTNGGDGRIVISQQAIDEYLENS